MLSEKDYNREVLIGALSESTKQVRSPSLFAHPLGCELTNAIFRSHNGGTSPMVGGFMA